MVEFINSMASQAEVHEELLDNNFEFFLSQNIDLLLPILVEKGNHAVSFEVSQIIPCVYKVKELEDYTVSSWSKSLVYLPIITLNEIEEHRLKSGKTPGTAIIKTLDRGRKFKNERYLSADSIFTTWDDTVFAVKGQCQASMKKEKRNVNVVLDRKTGNVSEAYCSCPAGNSGYCNHVMALLLEISEYSFNQLREVPVEIACTSRLRQWGLPGESTVKSPVMATKVQRHREKKGVSSTLYDPRYPHCRSLDWSELYALQASLKEVHPLIGAACSIPPRSEDQEKVNTPYGQFLLGSPLSFHLNPVEFYSGIFTNIEAVQEPSKTTHDYQPLPLFIFPSHSSYIPRDWALSTEEKLYLDNITMTTEQVINLERDTVAQGNSNLWTDIRKNKITASNAHKVFTRKRSFHTLVESLINPKRTEDYPKLTQEAMKHGKIYEPVAREKYETVLRYYLNRDISVRETGIVFQPRLSWLGASPDGLVSDKSKEGSCYGLIEIKCPRSRRHCSLAELIQDKSFYVTKENGELKLKKTHPNGYYTQVQMAMGLSAASFCDFVVYTFTGIIIIRTKFDKEYFDKLIEKLNHFYKNAMLPKIVENIAKT